MLSSIANLLPSSLHLNPNQELPRPNVNPDTEDEEDGEENNENEQNQRYGYQEAGPQPTKKEKEKEGKMPNEVCVCPRSSGPAQAEWAVRIVQGVLQRSQRVRL